MSVLEAIYAMDITYSGKYLKVDNDLCDVNEVTDLLAKLVSIQSDLIDYIQKEK